MPRVEKGRASSASKEADSNLSGPQSQGEGESKQHQSFNQPRPRDYFLWSFCGDLNKVLEERRKRLLPQLQRKHRLSTWLRAILEYRYDSVLCNISLGEAFSHLLQWWPEARVEVLTETTPNFPRGSYRLRRQPTDVILTDGEAESTSSFGRVIDYGRYARIGKSSYCMLVRRPANAAQCEEDIIVRTSLDAGHFLSQLDSVGRPNNLNLTSHHSQHVSRRGCTHPRRVGRYSTSSGLPAHSERYSRSY